MQGFVGYVDGNLIIQSVIAGANIKSRLEATKETSDLFGCLKRSTFGVLTANCIVECITDL